MFNIGKVKIKYPVLLAPMAGVTDMPFRTICKQMGASMMYTEFVSAEGIIRENTKTLDMIKFADFERPIGVQIFGDNPEVVGKSAKYIRDNFNPDIIDINFGCPVPKITKKGAGSAALKNLSLMNDIASSVVENANGTPVTAKIRAGWDSNSIVAIEAGKILEKCGLNAMTLHGRTTKQGYSGSSDWNLIKKLKNEINIPVIGNGDVSSISDFKKIVKQTGCDAVMIGRAALGNPWIFEEIKCHYENRKFKEPNFYDKVNTCLEHIDLLEKYKNEIACINLSKKHISYYIKSFKNSSQWRKKIMSENSINNIKNIIKDMRDSYSSE